MVTEIRWTHQNQQRKVGIETEMLVSLPTAPSPPLPPPRHPYSLQDQGKIFWR